jgi:RNA polymerase sigma-70 factor (sigma-E family)
MMSQPPTIAQSTTPELNYVSTTSERSFDKLFQSTSDAMVRLAYVLVGSNELAEEIVQDAYVRLLPRWDSIRDPRAYLRRSVVNLALDRLRRRRLEERFLRLHRPVDRSSMPPEDLLFDALEALRPVQKTALVLRYYSGLTDLEIAETMKCSLGTTKSHIHRGLKRLREVLDYDDEA